MPRRVACRHDGIMTDADRTAKQWGGLALGVLFVMIGVGMAVGAGHATTGVVLMVTGTMMAIGQAIWIARTRRKPD